MATYSIFQQMIFTTQNEVKQKTTWLILIHKSTILFTLSSSTIPVPKDAHSEEYQ